MQYDSVSSYISAAASQPPLKGPMAIILAEDPIEVDTTLRHHLQAGFRDVLMLAPAEIAMPKGLEDKVQRITHDVHAENAMMAAVNPLIDAFPGLWMYYCFNGEYLFYPFCEARTCLLYTSDAADE